MKKHFSTSTPESPKWDGGYSSGRICPKDIADKLFGGEIPGPWLCCYMLRRFGWPNEGSDDYKNLMSWCLTTPIKGLFLSVTPYLGGLNLHFGIRFTEAVGRKIDYDAGREHFWRRQDKEALRWWKQTGSKKFSFGAAKKDDKDEKLVHAYGEATAGKSKSMVWGLYERKPEHKGKCNITLKSIRRTPMLIWWLNDYRKKNGLGESTPKMTKRERETIGNPFRRKCERAIRQTMRDLLRPTNVRDISFTPFGDIERTPAAVKRYNKQESVEFFEGAGNTPEYWFSKAGRKEAKKKTATN